MNLKNTNSIWISGLIEENFIYDYSKYGEIFYSGKIAVPRLSSYIDKIPVTVPVHLMDSGMDYTDKCVEVKGQYRSFPLYQKGRKHLCMYVFAKELIIVNSGPDQVANNVVELIGFIVKPVTYRITPLGRKVADLLVAVERLPGETDYLHCIAWGSNADSVSAAEPGTRIQLRGRIQSREYEKQIGEASEKRTAYEVSISDLDILI